MNLEQAIQTALEYETQIHELYKEAADKVETSAFYEKMVRELPEEGRLFANFLKIEEKHLATVQFELDYLANTGYWFNFAEFEPCGKT
ncbi:MAG: hypothetical protein K9K79_02630 [Desulfohalobiaceae bacterium]|nr:hypothetical protein [Desulfohalobiaceae bacterium]